MPKDIREILKEAQKNPKELKENHRQRFEQRLQQLHKPKKKNYFFLKVAASLVMLLSIGYFSFFNKPVNVEQQIVEPKITSLSSVSPEMQKIENYYLAAINYEISSLEETPENKKILEDYLDKIGKLDADYKRLNNELSEKGINEKTINNLITNLQLRLQLLLQLKDQLFELRTSKTIKNENNTI
jgi:hypothetical protein